MAELLKQNEVSMRHSADWFNAIKAKPICFSRQHVTVCPQGQQLAAALQTANESPIYSSYPPLESRHAMIRRPPKSWGSFFSTTSFSSNRHLIAGARHA